MPRVSSVTSFFALLLFALSARALPSTLPTAPSTDQAGPFPTSTAEYRLKPSVDADVLAKVTTEIWARVYWPKTVENRTPNKHPLLVFLHGNHGTCGSGSDPRRDNSCQYTNEGTCPSDMVVTPNHEGYNYAAENLASWGYIVVSVNANRGITCGGGDSSDWGLILARGRLVLKHIEYWYKWSTQGGAPTSLGAPNLFLDSVDFSNVGLMGHSRGGEGVRAALNLYRDRGSAWQGRIPGLDIKAIYEIGAVDGQSTRVLNAPSVAWNQLLPLCDGDVSDLQGRLPFERMMTGLFRKSESEDRPSPKSLTMVWGANHNYFNTEWQTSDAYGCEGDPTHKPLFDGKNASLEQQSMARQSMNAFFRAHVGPTADPMLAHQFDSAYGLPKSLTDVVKIDRDYIPAIASPQVFLVEDFTSPTGTNPSGAPNEASGIKIDHDDGSEPTVGNISWDKAGADKFYQSNFAAPGTGTDMTSFQFLDFRVGRETTNAKNLAKPVSFSVQLVAADGSFSTLVDIATFSQLQGPPNDTTELTQTVRIPLTEFTNSKFDATNIRGVRFVFNKTTKAKIRLAHVRFGVETAVPPTLVILPIPSMFPPETTTASIVDEHMTPATLPASPKAQKGQARWLKLRNVTASPALMGENAVEITVEATDGSFPVTDELPVLRIENRLYLVSRFGTNGSTKTLTFSVPKGEYAAMQSGRAQVQIGRRNPSKVWSLPDFSKSVSNE